MMVTQRIILSDVSERSVRSGLTLYGLMMAILLLLGAHGAMAQPSGIGAPAPGKPANLSALGINEACVTVSREATPAVVSISLPIGKLDERRLQYYQDYLDQFGRRFNADKYTRRTSGSGVMVTRDGYLITNYHVIDGGKTDSILVTTSNKESYLATLVGSDPSTDLALLRIYGSNFTVPYLANSDSLHVGEWVVAVGNPLGLRSTVTVGIISALGRGDIASNEDERAIENFIQTDAAINPGNSGGGLFDLRGNLVGINTAIFSYTGFFSGYGFAVPSNLVRAVVRDLMDDGKISRGYLGISASDVNDSMAAAIGLDTIVGARVDDIDQNGPAQKAGLVKGDVILKVGDITIGSYRDLQVQLAQRRPGDSLHMIVRRSSGQADVHAVLAEGRNIPATTLSSPLPAGGLGLTLRPLEAGDMARLKLTAQRGMLVREVSLYGTGAKAGLLPDDVLLQIDGKGIYTPENVAKLLESRKAGEPVAITFWRDGKEVTRNGILQPVQ